MEICAVITNESRDPEHHHHHHHVAAAEPVTQGVAEAFGAQLSWRRVPGTDDVVVDGAEAVGATLRLPSTIDGRRVVAIANGYVSDDFDWPTDFGAFCNNRTLTKAVFPSTLRRVGTVAFSGCRRLQTVEFAEGLEEIGYGAFSQCAGIAALRFPETLRSIDSFAFESCEALKLVVIPEGVVTIGAYAFRDCGKLRSVVVPASVETIGENAFPDETRIYVHEGSYAEQWACVTRRSYGLV